LQKIGFPAPLPKKLLDADFVELRSIQNRLMFIYVNKDTRAGFRLGLQ